MTPLEVTRSPAFGTKISQSVGQNGAFAGISACQLDCVAPPDPWVAVGPNDVVQAVNTHIRVSSRSGIARATSSFAGFFLEPAGQLGDADPHVRWDQPHQRWLANAFSWDNSAGHLFLAISDGTDPAAGWTIYQFDFAGDQPDYPGLGITSDKVIFSANLFPLAAIAGSCGGGYDGAELLVVDWSDLIAAGSLSYVNTLPNCGLCTWRPAANLSTSATGFAIVQTGAARHVGFASISGTVAIGVTVSAVTDLTTSGLPAFATPPIPAGTTSFNSNTIDGRPTDALWQNGKLWFVSTYPCVPSGDVSIHDCVRATQVNTAGSPSVAQDFVVGDRFSDDFMGGIGLSVNGTMFLVYSNSSTSSFISTYAATQTPTDGPNTLEPALLVSQGQATYTSTTSAGGRWGDYVGVATDPTLQSAVWQADEYANAAGSWSTRVSMLRQITVPAAPGAVSATAGDASVRVSWTAPSDDGGSPITGYTVTSAPDAKTCTTGGALSCTVSGLTNGTPYQFTVTASNAIGAGAASAASAPVTPSTPPPVPPSAAIQPLPTFLVSTSIPVSWSAVPGSAAVTTYDVRYRRAAWNGGFGSYVTWLSATTARSATFADSAGTTYCFSVRAHDALGSMSAWSGETCTGVPLDDRSLARVGSWASGTGSAYYKSTFRRSFTSGASLVRTGVIARRLAIVATTCSTCGRIRVYWGSTLLRTISLYSSTTINRRLMTVITFTAARSGTVTIRVYGSGKRAIVDGLAIRRN